METMSRSLLHRRNKVVSDRRQGGADRTLGDSQREAGLIAAVIDEQGLEGYEISEARNHRLGQGRSEAERQVLHLGAVGEDVDQCICDAHWLRGATCLHLDTFGGDGEMADEAKVIFWDGSGILLEGLGTPQINGLAREGEGVRAATKEKRTFVKKYLLLCKLKDKMYWFKD